MSRKGFTIVPIFIILAVVLLFAGYFMFSRKIVTLKNLPVSQADTAHWQTYRNQNFGFEAKYPDTWTVGLEETDNITGKQISVALMKPYQSGDTQIPKAAVQFFIQYGADPKNLSIHSWAADQMQNLKASVAVSDTILGGQPAVELAGAQSSKSFFVRTNDVDILTVTYKPDPQFDPIYQAILSSIVFTR